MSEEQLRFNQLAQHGDVVNFQGIVRTAIIHKCTLHKKTFVNLVNSIGIPVSEVQIDMAWDQTINALYNLRLLIVGTSSIIRIIDPRKVEFDNIYKDELANLIKANIIISPTTIQLASGSSTNMYINIKRVAMSSRGMQLIGRFMGRILDQLPYVTAVGGPATGAIPIVMAIMATYKMRPLKYFYVRTTDKKHGLTHQNIEGELTAKDRILLVDDVLTSGTSILNTIELLSFNTNTINVAVVCNRNNQLSLHNDNILKIPVQSIFKLSELVKM